MAFLAHHTGAVAPGFFYSTLSLYLTPVNIYLKIMKFISSFFFYTRLFWLLSRLFLVLFFGYCAYFLLVGADTTDLITSGFFAVVGLGFLWNFFAGIFRKGSTNWLGKLLGCFLIPMGLFGLFSTLTFVEFIEFWPLIFGSLYLVLAGLFELVGSAGKRSVPLKAEFSNIEVNSAKD